MRKNAGRIKVYGGSKEERAEIRRLVRKHKLDRRKVYSSCYGVLVTDAKATIPCTGCSCDDEYPCSCCREKGPGCPECGFAGKRITDWADPVTVNGDTVLCDFSRDE